MEGLFLGGLVFGGLAMLAPLVLILGLIVVLALRGDTDDSGDRAAALYLASATAAALLTLVVALTTLAASVAELPGNNGEPAGGWFEYAPDAASMSGSMFSEEDAASFEDALTSSGEVPHELTGDASNDDRPVRGIAASAIAALVAFAVLRFHWPRLESLRTRAASGSAARRVHEAYCYVLCLAAVLTLLTSVSVALYGIVELVAPDTTNAGDRGDVVESMVPLLVLSAAAALVFRAHWGRVAVPTFLVSAPSSETEA